MIGYNPSHLNKNETLLEAFHRVEAYLKANPQYQVYQSSAEYQDVTQEYTLNTIIVPEGSKVSAGDVVLFSNVYYAVITSVSETTFSVENATNFRGEKGDSGVGNAKLSNTPGTSDTDGYTKNAVNGIVQNPNLLINPNFAINQRGQTSYTGAVYGVDRWQGQTTGVTVTTLDNGIRIAGQYSGIWQKIETNLSGQTVTASCKLSAINSGNGGILRIYYRTASSTTWNFIGQGVQITSVGIATLTVTIPDNALYVAVFIGSTGNSDVVFEWAKLEIGSVATEFSPPSIAEELEKCQRYYFDIGINGATSYLIGSGVFYNATLAYVTIPIPTTLRKAPTLILGDLSRLTLLGDGKSYTPTEITLLGTNNNSVSLRYSVTGATAGNGCAARLVNSENNNIGIIAFDAEI